MAVSHTYCKENYKEVSNCMRCNITGITTWTDAKGHKAALKNIWLAPGFMSQKD